MLAGCSASQRENHPSVTFASGASAAPGMPGMSAMPSTPTAPGTAASTAPAAPASGDAVSIDNFAFVPAKLSVAAGSTVTWTNRDEEPHTVAASDGSFHSPGMGAQASYSHTFSAPGTVDYICSIHPFMRGTVVVTP
ncbi:cupredoxin family copper-binding protein [uncultured Mycobacterium sp.]|uniref:cupredoxin domain-containing protein n=1 Tax=uncultured Mycobacterium sp. TaxID=171292 RepID=UPI0035CC8F5B